MRDDSTDTIRLTELFFARDEEALRETARLYEPLCMHIALNILADRQDAEECVNDTWLRAWNHIPPDRPRSMAAYLGTVVRNLAINRWRARRNRALTVDLDELRETIPMTEETRASCPDCWVRFSRAVTRWIGGCSWGATGTRARCGIWRWRTG